MIFHIICAIEGFFLNMKWFWVYLNCKYYFFSSKAFIVCSLYESSPLEQCDAPSPVYCTGSLLVSGREASLVILNHCTFPVPFLRMGNSIPVSFSQKQTCPDLELLCFSVDGQMCPFHFYQNLGTVRKKGKKKRHEWERQWGLTKEKPFHFERYLWWGPFI